MQELFKSFARYLSHLLAEGRNRGKAQGKCLKIRPACITVDFLVTLLSVPAVKAEAKALIRKFFSRVQHCKSEADWKSLKIPNNWKTPEDKK